MLRRPLESTSYPSLWTVDPGRRQIAETAVDLLIARIAGGVPVDGEVQVVAPDFRIVQRESTAG